MTARAVREGGGGLTGLGIWRYRTATGPSPAAGQLQFDNVTIDSATNLYVNVTNDGGTDMSAFLALIESGDLIYIQIQSDATQFVVVEVGVSSNAAGVYTFPILNVEGQGAAPTNNTEVGVVSTVAGGSVVASTLQAGYNIATAPPQILINATPDPLALRASVAGPVFQVQDTLGANIFEVDDTFVEVDGLLRVQDAFTNHGSPNSVIIDDTFSSGGAFIGASILSSGTLTATVSSTWIWSLVQDAKLYQMGVDPAFAAWALFNVLCTIENAGNFNLVQAIVMNNGSKHRRTTSGTSTVQQNVAVSNSPNMQVSVSGAVLTKLIGDTGIVHAPKFVTVNGATVNGGTSRGLLYSQPAVALFGTQNGVENYTAFIAVDVNALPGFGNIVKAAVRSNIGPTGTNAWFLLNNGNAHSDHGAGHIYFDDNAGIAYGGISNLSFDVWQTWNGAGNYFRTYFNANADSLRWSNPAADRYLFDNDGGSTSGEYNWNCARFSLGAQTGAVGNQVGVFVTPARTMTVGGGWSDFLLTQGANITVDAAAGQLFGWTLNAPSITLGTGSVTDAGGLLIGGNVSQGTNRYGLLVLSSPSGGTLNYCARFQGAAGVLVDGVFEHGGATLGFYGTAPIAQPAAVPVTIGAVHAALVSLGLIT